MGTQAEIINFIICLLPFLCLSEALQLEGHKSISSETRACPEPSSPPALENLPWRFGL